MIVQEMSDLHFEFHADRGKSFVESLDPEGVDVLILAGDICLAWQLYEVMEWFCAKYPYVLHVLGNHSFYNSDRETVHGTVRDIMKSYKNYKRLDCSIVEIDGRRFLGTLMWFPYKAGNKFLESKLNDFNMIRDFDTWVYEENDRAMRFLHDNVQEGDIVVTHHLPSYKSISARHKVDILNCFFVSPEAEEVIIKNKPKLWFHGHTHDRQDYKIGGTRIICNPYGYLRYEVPTQRAFDYKLTVEV